MNRYDNWYNNNRVLIKQKNMGPIDHRTHVLVA
ncbi:IS3 family transposase [Ligilactobacillus agilis]